MIKCIIYTNNIIYWSKKGSYKFNGETLPFTQFIFEQGSDLEDIYELFRKEIKDTEGVENITELNLTPDASEKGLRIDFSVNDGVSRGTVEVTI